MTPTQAEQLISDIKRLTREDLVNLGCIAQACLVIRQVVPPHVRPPVVIDDNHSISLQWTHKDGCAVLTANQSDLEVYYAGNLGVFFKSVPADQILPDGVPQAFWTMTNNR